MRRQPCKTDYVDFGGGEFDRQGHAIQTPADLANNRRFGVAQSKPIPHGSDPLDEKLDRRVAQGLGCGKLRHVRRVGQRRHDSHPLTRHTQGFAAGGEYMDSWRAHGDCLDQASRSVNDMLTIVDHQRHLPPMQKLVDVAQRVIRSGGHPKDRSDRGGNRHRLCGGRQVDETDAVTIRISQRFGAGNGNPGLADPTRSDDRGQPPVRQLFAQAIDEIAAPNEPGHRGRQPAASCRDLRSR